MFFRKEAAYLKGHSVFQNASLRFAMRFGVLAKLKTLGFALFIAKFIGNLRFFENQILQ